MARRSEGVQEGVQEVRSGELGRGVKRRRLGEDEGRVAEWSILGCIGSGVLCLRTGDLATLGGTVSLWPGRRSISSLRIDIRAIWLTLKHQIEAQRSVP